MSTIRATRFFLEHFVTKGKEAALACLNTVAALNELPARAATAA